MAEASSSQPTYSVNERCLCYHGPLIYEAKILNVEVNDTTPNAKSGQMGPHYYVHYKGWKQTWDEWVPTDRLLKWEESNIAKQKALQQHAQAANAASAKQSHTKGKSFYLMCKGRAGTSRDRENTSTVGTRTGTRKDGARGTKRAREDDDTLRRSEMKLTVPEILKVTLVDDWEAVTKNNQLVTLPRNPTALDILKEFEDHVKANRPEGQVTQLRLMDNTTDYAYDTIYFDRALGSNLLYRFERPQYAGIRKQYITGQTVKVGEEKEMSVVYGAEHLLRMLVSLPQLIMNSQMDAESVGLIRDYVNELLKYMETHKDRIFQKEYETATVPYQNLSRS
ncbi:Esa1p-associated factor [Paramarasmius palmivorus]|uniref:Chromatin modification-related protein EAF3 n=1 Tax=Paramarasmius palmivorus TaxID=297713 RepID=A0AAW0DAQ5_9AGAR